MKKISLFWAFKNGKIVHVSEVQNGLKCECNCPVCNGKLEAHKGEVKTHHFKHHKITDCKGSLETSTHLAAKRLFLSKKEVLLPDLFADVPEFGELKVQSRKLYKSKTVIEECKIDDFQPDIFMEMEIKRKRVIDTVVHTVPYTVPLIIEIAVTHFVDAEKLEKIKKKGFSAIEINLNKIDKITNDEELWKELTNNDNIKWLFHSKLPKLIENKRIVKVEERRVKVEYEKNCERRRIEQEKEREEERENETKELQKQNFLLKIYGFDIVYCPKDKVNNQNKKITLDECENCNYHLKTHYKTIHYDSDSCVVCGFKSKTLRDEI